MNNTINILNYKISNSSLDSTVITAIKLLEKKDYGHYVSCANPHSIVVARSDPLFSEALKHSDILLPDGAGIVLAAKILKLPLVERVAGFEFFVKLNKVIDQKRGYKVLFMGSSQNVLDEIKKKMAQEFSNIEVVGCYSPPFKSEFTQEENQLMVEYINHCKPDIVWVGMTAPKQEKWIYENRKYIKAPLICAIGAVFDFYAGTKNRAPIWVQKIGLEWLPRLLHEPKRLFRRNFISSPIFLVMVAKQLFSKR